MIFFLVIQYLLNAHVDGFNNDNIIVNYTGHT